MKRIDFVLSRKHQKCEQAQYIKTTRLSQGCEIITCLRKIMQLAYMCVEQEQHQKKQLFAKPAMYRRTDTERVRDGGQNICFYFGDCFGPQCLLLSFISATCLTFILHFCPGHIRSLSASVSLAHVQCTQGQRTCFNDVGIRI
jgi:hypothetical protein